MKVYYVDELEVSKEQFETLLEISTDEYVDEHYDEMLDNDYGYLTIANCKFQASDILKKLDNVLYLCEMDTYKTNILNNAKYFIERTGFNLFAKRKFEVKEKEEESIKDE